MCNLYWCYPFCTCVTFKLLCSQPIQSEARQLFMYTDSFIIKGVKSVIICDLLVYRNQLHRNSKILYFRNVTLTPLLFACEITLAAMTRSRINGGKTIDSPPLSGRSLRYTYLDISAICVKFIRKIKGSLT